MLVTKLEAFISDGLTNDEVAQDLNDLYLVINNFAKVRSSDYRCYVTPQRVLVTLFLVDDIDIETDMLEETIINETVLRSYGISSVKVILDKNAFDVELEYSNAGVISNLGSISSPTGNLRLLYSQVSSKLIQLPEYKQMIDDILKIEGLDQHTLLTLLETIDVNTDTDTRDVKMSDRYLILNTIEVFLSDMTDVSSVDRDKLDAIREYFYPHSDDLEAIAGDLEKGQLSTLQFLLGSDPKPFVYSAFTLKGREICIKCYLLFALSYQAFQLERKVEQSKHLRSAAKRQIGYCQEILSGERDFKRMDKLIDYLTLQNPQFNPQHPTERDKANLKELIFILENKQEHYYHRLAKSMKTLFDPKSHRPLNRILTLIGFPSIGNSTKV